MDPLTQGLLGASLPQSLSKKKSLAIVAIIGLISGLAPDLDIFIRSENDPLLFLEYHRQFTHSLIFIPFGGLICATFIFFLFSKRYNFSFKETWIYSTCGYATHGLLDACTSYGTLLFWPFSETRIAWNNISIIDPLFTIPILILVVIASIKKNKLFSKIAISWIVIYLTLGHYQKNQAFEIAKKIAKERDHQIMRIDVKPSIGNILLWKSIYETKDKYYIDAIRIGWDKKIYYGESVDKINIETAFPWLTKKSQQAEDIKRFEWFSNGYIAINPNNKNQILDIRYSRIPNEIGGLWGIELDEKKGYDEHAKYITNRAVSKDRFIELKKMLFK